MPDGSALGPDWALQATLYAHLTGDPALTTHLGHPVRLYDVPPADPIFPFAVFGRSEATPSDADDAVVEHVVHLHVWSRYGGRQEAKAVAAALRASLEAAPLALPAGFETWRLVSLRPVYTDVFRGPDGRTAQAIVRLRAVTEVAAPAP